MRKRLVTAVEDLDYATLMAEACLFPHTEKFHGPDLTERDQQRLTKQQQRLVDLMASGAWWTLAQIHEATGIPEASASAQLRHIDRAGLLTKEREHLGGGLNRYRLVR